MRGRLIVRGSGAGGGETAVHVRGESAPLRGGGEEEHDGGGEGVRGEQHGECGEAGGSHQPPADHFPG